MVCIGMFEYLTLICVQETSELCNVCTVLRLSGGAKRDAWPRLVPTLGWLLIWGPGMQTKLLRWVIYSRIDLNLISVAFQVQRHFDAAAKEKNKGGLDEKDETVRGSLPLFKLRSREDRERWRKLVSLANFCFQQLQYLFRHSHFRTLSLWVKSTSSTRWILRSWRLLSLTFNPSIKWIGNWKLIMQW